MPRNVYNQGDLQMYFNGSYVCKRQEDGTRAILCVRDVVSNRGHLFFLGDLYYLQADRTVQVDYDYQMPVEEYMESPFMPNSGYYNLGGTGVGYIEFSVEKRTSRKGLLANRIVWNGRQVTLNSLQILHIYNPSDFEGRISNDLWKASNNDLHWRGKKIGRLNGEELELTERFQFLQPLLNKHLNRG